MTKKPKIYAIGFRDWVELRKSVTRPRACPSETIVMTKVGRKEVKTVLRQVTHTGGHVIGCVKAWIFEDVTGKFLRLNQVVPVSSEDAKALLSKQVVH